MSGPGQDLAVLFLPGTLVEASVVCLPAVRAKLGVRGLGNCLGRTAYAVLCPVPSPSAGGDHYPTIPVGLLHSSATVQGWSHVLVGCGSPLDRGNGYTNMLKGHFSGRHSFSISSSLMSE